MATEPYKASRYHHLPRMSNAAKPRSAAQHDRMPSASLSRRAPTSRASVRDRLPSSGEVVPDDSASNVSHRRVPSGSSRVNGTSKFVGEKQTGKFQVTSRDSVQIRTRSPMKSSFEDIQNLNGSKARGEKEIQPGRRGISGVKKEKHSLRMDKSGRASVGKALTCQYCSAMEAIGISRAPDESAVGPAHYKPSIFYAASRFSGARAYKTYVHR